MKIYIPLNKQNNQLKNSIKRNNYTNSYCKESNKYLNILQCGEHLRPFSSGYFKLRTIIH